MIHFSDGVSIDTSGDYRIIHLKDGYYVTGHGILCPVDSQLEGERLIDELNDILSKEAENENGV